MNIRNMIAIVGGVAFLFLLLILVGAVLMHWGKGGGRVEHETGDAPVSTAQTDAQNFNAVTNSKPSISIPEEVPTVEAAESSNSNEINIAGKNYPVLFEGQSVPGELKRIIIGDLELNLSHFQRIDFMDLAREGEEPAAQIYQQKITHWLSDGLQQRYFPGAVEKYFGGAVRAGDTFQLVIHAKLVEEYKQAVKLRTEHAEMFEKLEGFIQLLSNKAEIHSLADGNVDAIRSLMYFHGIPEPASEEEYKKGVRSWDSWVRPPSLLDVRLFGDVVKHGTASEDVYVFVTLIANAARDPKYLMKRPMGVFVDGEWRILIMPGP